MKAEQAMAEAVAKGRQELSMYACVTCHVRLRMCVFAFALCLF